MSARRPPWILVVVVGVLLAAPIAHVTGCSRTDAPASAKPAPRREQIRAAKAGVPEDPLPSALAKLAEAPDKDSSRPQVDPTVCGAGLRLPDHAHYAAPGLVACAVGRASGNLRQLTFAPNGDLFGVSSSGIVFRFRDFNGDGAFAPAAPETVEWASTGGNGNNCHIDAEHGYLYAGTPTGVRRWKWAPELDAGGDGEDVVVKQPSGGGHGRHTTHVYDGFLYVQSGSEGNATNRSTPEYDTHRSVIKRFDLSAFDPAHPFDWHDGEVFAQGLRNTVGFTRNAAGRMYGVVNGLDNVTRHGRDVHSDNPGEQIVALEKGKRFGYPFCYTAQRIPEGAAVVAPGTQVKNELFPSPHDDAWCAENSDKPATFVQAHSAPLDIAFFEGPGGKLPSRWRGGAFVALHGSWDREPPTGYKVVWIPFSADGTASMPTSSPTETRFPYEVVFGGGTAEEAKDGPWGWEVGAEAEAPVRPVGVAVSPIDGSLYVSSDNGSIVYRVFLP